jgi:Uma2 family endonuclease
MTDFPIAPPRPGMSLAQFIEETHSQDFEHINGERKPRLTTIGIHNVVVNALYRLLLKQVTDQGLGEVLMEATYILPDRYDENWVTGSRTPDILIYAGERFAQYRLDTPDWDKKPYLLVPDVVIEVLSPNDKALDVDEKIDAYLLDGVQLVIIIYPERRKAILVAPDFEQPHHLKGDAWLEMGDVVTGVKFRLNSLFA